MERKLGQSNGSQVVVSVDADAQARAQEKAAQLRASTRERFEEELRNAEKMIQAAERGIKNS